MSVRLNTSMLFFLAVTSVQAQAQAPSSAGTESPRTPEQELARLQLIATDPAILRKEGSSANACHSGQDVTVQENFTTQRRASGSTTFNAVPGQAMDRDPILVEDRVPLFFPRGHRRDVGAFTAMDRSGETLSISSLKGKPVLVFLFKPECKFTADLLPDILRLQKIEDRFGFKVIAANLSVEGWSGLTRWQRQNNTAIPMDYPFYKPSSTPGKGASVFPDFRVVPTVYLIDAEGGLAWRVVGAIRGSLSAKLNLLLAERNSTAR